MEEDDRKESESHGNLKVLCWGLWILGVGLWIKECNQPLAKKNKETKFPLKPPEGRHLDDSMVLS